MPLYYYQAIDAKGKKSTKTIEAPHEKEARERLRRQGVLVIGLSAQNKKSWLKKNPHLEKEALVTFTTQLAELLKASLPLYESLLSLEEQYRLESFHPVILAIAEEIKSGSALSKALAKHPESFNEHYIALVHAGESIGAIDKALEKLQHLLVKQMKLQKATMTALLYPAVLLCFSCFTLVMLLTFVIPSIEVIFADRPCNMITTCIISASHFVTRFWPLYLPLTLLTAVFGFYYTKKQKTRLWLSKKALSLPLIRSLIIESVLARFARTLGSLLKGGVSMIEAIALSRKVMRHPLLEEVVFEAEKKIVAGSFLSKELKKSPLIPTLVPRLLAVGEESGSLADMLLKIADIYEGEVEKRVGRLLALSQPAILLIMGAIIGLIMLAVLLPLTDINSFLGG